MKKTITAYSSTIMERSIRLLAATIVALLVQTGAATLLTAQTPGPITLPQYLSYQGVLTDENRAPIVDGTTTITFKLYTDATGGTPIWVETQQVSTVDGVFDAYLGLTTPMTLPFDRQYWIAAQVQGQAEMEPRTRLVPAAYAMTAGTAVVAQTLSGGVVASINGLQGDLILKGTDGVTVTQEGNEIIITAEGDKSLSFGSMWVGDASNVREEMPVGTPGQILAVNAQGTSPEWTSDLNVATIRVRTATFDSVLINDGMTVNGPTVFNDTVTFNGPVNFNFPFVTFDDLTENAIWIGNDENKLSELLSTNVRGSILQQDAAGTPIWSNDLVINNLTVNGPVTDINSQTINIGTPTSITTFDGEVIFNITPRLALARANMIVGGSNGFQTPMAPGDENDILMMQGGWPTWVDGSFLLPEGTQLNTILTWNGTSWVENTKFKVDGFGNTTIAGGLTVEGTSVILPGGSISNFELENSQIGISHGPGISGSTSVTLGNTMTINNTGVIAITGTANQVNASAPNGNVTLSLPQNIDPNATPTFNSVTLDNLATNAAPTVILTTDGSGTVQQTSAAAILGGITLNNKSLFVGDATNKPSELASTNVAGAVLQQDATGTPVWGNSLTAINNLTVNGTTNLNGTTNNIGGPTSTNTFNGTTVFNGPVKLPLALNHIWRGDATGYQAPLAPGTNGQVLRIDGTGAPTWQTINTLPNGTVTNATLVWNGSAWVENTKVTMNPTTGATTITGDMTVTGDVVLANGVINNNELQNSSVTVNAGTGLSGGGVVALGGSITLNSTGVTGLTAGPGISVTGSGNMTVTNTGVRSAIGTPNQVIVSNATGDVTYSLPQNIHSGATPTFAGATLTGMPSGSTSTEVVVEGPGGVLQTRAMNILPNGTTTNATLVWNGTSWIENNKVLMNPTNGNTSTTGNLTIGGSLSGAGSNKYAGTVAIPLNAFSVSIPYAGITAGASVNVEVMDNNAMVGIVPARVTAINPGVGFTVELSINYDSPTGKIHYVVVNP